MIFAKMIRRYSSILLGSMMALSSGMATDVVWKLPSGNHGQSTGVSMDRQFYIEVGRFSAGFMPTASNFGEWSSSWMPLARQRYAPGEESVNEGRVLEEFPEGDPAYAWAFNVDEPTREWALLSDSSWTWPSSTGGNSFFGTSRKPQLRC